MKRFYVQSDHVRGERRYWYVMERVGERTRNHEMVIGSTRTTEASAQKIADNLNAEFEAKE